MEAAIIIKPMQTRINHEKNIICVIRSLELLKKLKNDHVPYLGIELTIHVIKSQIHLVRQSLSSQSASLKQSDFYFKSANSRDYVQHRLKVDRSEV